jgi:hypothetical protein
MSTRQALLICFIFVVTTASASFLQVNADDVQLTLDLRQTSYSNPKGGGIWQLYARIVDNAGSVDGSHGLASVRAILKNVNATDIAFNMPAINATGAMEVTSLSNGAVKINYSQDRTGAAKMGLGVPPVSTPNRDLLVASGTWLAGPRPVFAVDPEGLASGATVWTTPTAPFEAVAPNNSPTSVVTLGDLRTTPAINAGIINGLDRVDFLRQLPGASMPAPYNPAADIDQNGVVNNLDTVRFIKIFTGQPDPAVNDAPEP